jgi:uncharacterized protein YggE
MKPILTLAILLLALNGYSQSKTFLDQPYLETTASVDTLVVPDKIYIAIILNEADSKNKKSTEELERILQSTLKALNIDTERDLSLSDYNSNFKSYLLKLQNILKIKNYSLLVHDAMTVSRVFQSLEDVGISNVHIDKTEYSKSEALTLELKSLAIKKAKATGLKLVVPLNQRLGKAILISDNMNYSNNLQGQISGIRVRGTSGYLAEKAVTPISIEFQKMQFQAQVSVKFLLE